MKLRLLVFLEFQINEINGPIGGRMTKEKRSNEPGFW